MTLSCAISPCPNDTFLFYGWAEGLIDHPVKLQLSFFDIETLNNLALKNEYSLIKLSCNTLAKISRYEPIPIGAALGFNQGPKLIAKKPFSLKELANKTIAIPGRGTTAHLLFQDLFPFAQKKTFCFYHEIFDQLNHVDAAIVIHESRFTFHNHGFCELADLGELYTQKYQLPLALGALAVRKELPEATKKLIVNGIEKSLVYAKKHLKSCQQFVLKHAQEKDISIIQKHIALYVNEETEHLSILGQKAIDKIFEISRKHETLSFCSSS